MQGLQGEEVRVLWSAQDVSNWVRPTKWVDERPYPQVKDSGLRGFMIAMDLACSQNGNRYRPWWTDGFAYLPTGEVYTP
jgi:hypothetical protein